MIKAMTRRRAVELARGSISVLLVIVLVPVISVAGLFVDASRVQLAKSEVAAAGDLTLNTALSNYDTVLKDVYGLFAISQSEEELHDNLRSYFTAMLINSGLAESAEEIAANPLLQHVVDVGAGDSSNLLAMEIANPEKDISLSGVEGSSLSDPTILKNQIVEFEKYRAPMNAAFSILDGISYLSKMGSQMKVSQKSAEVDESLGELNKACKDLYEKAKEFEDYNKALYLEGDKVTVYNETLTYGSAIGKYVGPAAAENLILQDRDDDGIAQSEETYSKYRVSFAASGTVETLGNGNVSMGNLSRFTTEQLEEECRNSVSRLAGSEDTARWERIRKGDCGELGEYYKLDVFWTAYHDYMMDVYRLWFEYETLLGKIDEEGNLDEYLADKGKSLSEDVQAALATAYACMGGKKAADQSSMHNYTTSNEWIKAIRDDSVNKINQAAELGSILEECVKRAKKVDDEVKNVTDANEGLKSEIDRYGETDAFASEMSASYESNKKLIDQAEFDKLKALFGQWQGKTQEWSAYLSNTKYLDKHVSEYSDTSRVRERFEMVSGAGTGGMSIAEFILRSVSDSANDTAIDNLVGFVATGRDRPALEKEVTLRGNGFYQYLEKTFSNPKVDAKDQEGLRDTLNNTGKDQASEATSEPDNLSGGSISELIADAGDGSDEGTIDTDKIKTDGYSGMLKNMSEILTSIPDVKTALKDTRDNLYICDYAFNMFSWYTQENEYKRDESKKNKAEKPTTATGIPLSEENNYFYRAEIEYLCYGKDTAAANVKSAKSFIFVIRFACNSLYALTSGDINAKTLGPALAIQAASMNVVPYKLPQFVMKLALALCESGIDMHELMEGKAVPFFKDATTFTVGGDLNAVKNMVTSVVSDTIEDTGQYIKGSANVLIDTGTDKLEDGLEDFGSLVGDAAKGQVEQVVGGVFNTFSTMVQSHISRITGRLNDNPKEVAEEIVNEADKAARAYIDQNNGTIHDALLSAYETFASNQLDVIKQEIADKISELKSNADAKPADLIESLNNRVQGLVNKAIDDTIASLQGTVVKEAERLGLEAKEKFAQGVDKGVEAAKEATANGINSWFEGTFGNYTGSSATAGSNGKISSGFASCLKFKYSDYLKIILFIKLCANSDDQIARIGNLITANVRSAGDGSDLHHVSGGEFTLAKAYTYYEMKATVRLKTMFLAMPLVTSRMGTEDVYAFVITYHGALGY